MSVTCLRLLRPIKFLNSYINARFSIRETYEREMPSSLEISLCVFSKQQ